ncbi:hypothetical protein ACIA58_31740 [Kribbella sp. NPDC051586]|uniref:hypothetical protein n=1 Tax=Kribbella sp. NPDC051586 TaxID=3364118 RepID=UPI00378BD807
MIHARVERLVTRAERRTRLTSSALIAGLISPSTYVSNPTYKAVLQEIESQILQRADWLLEHAASANEAWYCLLADSASEPTELRRHLIRDIAAYRELHHVQGSDPVGPPPSVDHVQLRHHNRLKQRLQDVLRDDASKPLTPDVAPNSLPSKEIVPEAVPYQ